MRGSKQDVPVTMENPQATIREVEWSDIHAGFESFHVDVDMSPLLQGLPDNRCQCPHWGYVLKGRIRVQYPNREEILNAGDAYYMAPGHLPFPEAGTEVIEFSPKGDYQKTLEAITRNLMEMQGGVE